MPAGDVEPVALDIAADWVFRPEPEQFLIGHLPDILGLLGKNAMSSAFDRPSEVARL